MLLQKVFLCWCFIVSHILCVSAGGAGDVSLDLSRRPQTLEDPLRQDAEDFIATLLRRQAPSSTAPASTVPTAQPTGDASTFDPIAWETQTEQACQTALSALQGKASNPSGIAVCYNLPFMDNSTGFFQAEMRMYNITTAIDEWTGVTAEDISLTVSYVDATVQATDRMVVKRDGTLTWPPVRGRGVVQLVRKQKSGPSKFKVMNYVGQINNNLASSALSVAQLQSLLTPSIRLSAVSPQTNEGVTTTLSSTEASFVNGAFAKPIATPTNAAVGETPFVLPGTTLGVFPTGLIITLVWAGGFAVAVGYGTIGRIRFRDQYRRRKKRELAIGMRTI